MKNIEDIIKKHTTDAGTDWEKVKAEINEHVNGIVVKQTEKAKEQAVEQARADMFKGLGIEGVEDEKALKTKIKELSQVDSESKKQYEETQKSLEELQAKYEDTAKTADTLTKEKMLLQHGVTDPDDFDYVMHNVSKRVGEDKDFTTALNEFKEEKPKYFVKNPTTTGTKAGGSKPPQTYGWEDKLAEKHPELKNEGE